MLTRGAKYGRFIKSKDGTGRALYAVGLHKGSIGVRGDYRTDPSGRAPIGFARFVMATLRAAGHPMSEAELIEGFLAFRLERAQPKKAAPR
jgi:hypothetical protein